MARATSTARGTTPHEIRAFMSGAIVENIMHIPPHCLCTWVPIGRMKNGKLPRYAHKFALRGCCKYSRMVYP